MCGCYVENINTLYMNGSSCSVCNLISDPISNAQCKLCNGGPYGYGLFGCVNCTAIPFGTGALMTTSIGTCLCLKGYTFNFNLGACICSHTQWYGIVANGTCQVCSSLTPSSLYLACVTCQPPFYYDGYVCLMSSKIGNIVTTTNACPANFIFAANPVTNETLRCVCSHAAGYYTNASSCLSCTTQPIPGVAVTDCIACSLTANFYLSVQECIYCLNSPYTTGVAAVSGCLCIANYFWSAITSSCQCDWTIGYYGAPGSCINCFLITNAISASSTGCGCVIGYKWNGTQCICDTTNGAFLSVTLQCINCNKMIGALINIISNNSCSCIVGYTWNSTLGYCVCDYTQNFYLINSVCYDCTAIANTNGAASQSGCGCSPGLTWISSLNMCGCPLGYVNMGTYCGSCSVVALSTGATVTGCQICNNTQGFFLSGGICYACSKQKYTSGLATSAGCTCVNSSLVWSTTLNSCTCSFTVGRITQIISGSLSCVACSALSCSCGYTGTGTIYLNGICVNCAYVPSSTGVASNGLCVCLTGYAWSSSIYPYQCYCSFQLGYYVSSTCSSCSALPLTGAITSSGCQTCTYTQGFLRLSNDTCILCSSLPNTNGLATIAGCGCSTGVWDPVLLKCSTVSCPTGYIFSSQNQACICNPSTSSGVVSCNPSCSPTTSVMIGNLCFNCLTVAYSTGPV